MADSKTKQLYFKHGEICMLCQFWTLDPKATMELLEKTMDIIADTSNDPVEAKEKFAGAVLGNCDELKKVVWANVAHPCEVELGVSRFQLRLEGE